MKTQFLLCLLFLALTGNAQFTTIAKGPAFEEPEEGFAKLLMMKNGNTAYILVTKDNGIQLKLYGPDHKQLLSKVVNHKFGKLKGLQVEGCLETQGNITVLMSEFDSRTPALDRVVIDEKGMIVSQETIATLNKVTMGQGYAMAFGGVPMPDFIVRRDPYSENYVVASFNSFASERDKRIEVVHYNSKNEVVSKSYLSTPENKYKYINILDICVFEDKEAYALVYAFNTAASGGKDADLLLAKFTKNSTDVKYENLHSEEGLEVTDAILKFNRVTQKLHILSHIHILNKNKTAFFKKQDSKITFATIHYIYDISKGSITSTNELDLGPVDQKYKELFGKKENYSGVLQNFYLNNDGGYTIILEGLYVETTQRMSMGGGSSSSSTSYKLNDIAVLNYDQKGNLVSSTLIPKSQVLNNSIMSGGGGVTAAPLYHYKRDFTAQWLKGGNQYKSFAYLNGKTKNYILMNDIEENEERISKGKLTTIQSVKECDGFSFETNSGNILPSRKFVFDGGTKKEHNLALFAISDYNLESNVYVTLKLEVDGRDQKVRVVWLQP